jgi:hypothetical protein
MAISGDYGKFFNRFACFVNGNNNQVSKTEQTDTTTKAAAKPVEVASQDTTKLTDGDWKTLCGINISKPATNVENKEIAYTTNKVLTNLGYNYKVSELEVARVTEGLEGKVIPGLNTAAYKATEVRVGETLKKLGLA